MSKNNDKRITHARAVQLMHQAYDDLEEINLEVITEMISKRVNLTEDEKEEIRKEYLEIIGERGAMYFLKKRAEIKRKG